jgi:hypothetical protein
MGKPCDLSARHAALQRLNERSLRLPAAHGGGDRNHRDQQQLEGFPPTVHTTETTTAFCCNRFIRHS